MEFLINVAQIIASGLFVIGIISIFDSINVEEFVIGVIFSVMMLSCSYIPYSFLPCTLKESVLVEGELLEHKDSFRLMVDKDDIYIINGYKEVTQFKTGQFNVYRQKWENKHGIKGRNITRVFDFEGNLILDL